MGVQNLPPRNTALLAGLIANTLVGIVACLFAGVPTLQAALCGVGAAVAMTAIFTTWLLLSPVHEDHGED